jgi:PAS domain S-box-containing protein
MLKKEETGRHTAKKHKDIPTFNENNKTNMLINDRIRLEAILELSDAIFLMLDKAWNIVFLNERGHEILGVKDVVGENYENLLGGQIKDESILSFKKFLDFESGENEKCEIVCVEPSGYDCILSWQKTFLRDERGKVVSVVATGKNITERKKEENIQKVISQILQAASTERNLDELFKFIHDSVSMLMSVENFYIALHDKENNMITFPYFIDKYDTDDSPKTFGNGLTEYVIRKGKAELISREMDEELAAKGETELIGTQSEIWLGVPLKIKGNTIGVLAVQDYENQNTYTEKHKEILEAISHPISMAIERKRVELEREKLIEKLSELNESKDKLFSLISHDLRGPFNSLLGFSEILTSEYDSLTDDEIKQYLNVIYESSQNLYGMTNNLLQYSRFQMGRIEFKAEKLNLEKIINNNTKLLKGNVVKKGISFIIKIEPDIQVIADEDMLNSVIQNLLSNAIKFTNKGGDVIISAKKMISPENITEVELKVEDTGIGISDANMRRIQKGEMFSTLGTEREYGTGLGIVLVKEFIEKNRGRLKIESELNKGTRFICYFPYE